MRILGNRALVRRIDFEKQNKSGIIIPSQVRSHTYMGEVIKTGEGISVSKDKKIPMEIKPGDCVIYSSTIGWHLDKGDEQFTIINEMDVLVIIRDGEMYVTNSRILAEEPKSDVIMVGGIVLPTQASKDNPDTKEVIVLKKGPGAIAKDGSRIPIDINIGDKLLIPANCGHTFKKDGREYIVIAERDIIGIMEGGD